MNFLFYVLFFTIVDELASDEDEINEDDVQYIESLALKVRKGNCLFLLFITLNGVNNEIEQHLGNSCAIRLRSRPPTPAIEFQSIWRDVLPLHKTKRSGVASRLRVVSNFSEK